jgi:molybdopterin-guanine dinucleotide biosynthesis protein A
MLVTAPSREHPPAWERFDCEVIDPVAGEGPLRGLLTAMENVGTEFLLLLSVDMPLIERGQLRCLTLAMRDRPHAMGIMLRHLALEPFPSIYRRSAIDIVRRRLRSDRKSLNSLTDEMGFEILEAPTQWDACVWTNLNTPDDLSGLT